MALTSTMYTFDVALSDVDRGVYEALTIKAACHPSETEDYFAARILAYCLEYTEGIAFSNGLFESDQPTIAVRDLTGALRVWIDVGAPEAARLHRAAKLAPRVAIYTNKDAVQLAARLGAERIHRVAAMELYAVDRDWLARLAARLTRRMEFTLTVAERHLYVSLGEETLAGIIERVEIGGTAGS